MHLTLRPFIEPVPVNEATNPLLLLSVNGPQFTVINGGGTNQCISLNDGASLTGFMLTNGFSGDPNGSYLGGGMVCTSTNVFMTNCVITGNSGYGGGGAYGGTLHSCTLIGNSAWFGGGATLSMLYNCTLTGIPLCGEAERMTAS